MSDVVVHGVRSSEGRSEGSRGASASADPVGRFVDASTLLLAYGCPRELLRRMTTARVLLALPTPAGSVGYPEFQFDSDGEPLPGLDVVLGALDPVGAHAWRDAVWLVTPSDALSGSTPAAVLRAGRVDDVLAAVGSGIAA
ncbi:hypothetical protein [Frondihabitans peucedani]|jgi:hypothetical protein|uniref:Antitoxin Xre/MbcA/ParS-like toxin-binding domain-containing protein n=1 Tax=Frondihabitans peucedani TaxID=598626 RepID=A0ABP8E6K3_9MICO